MLQRAARSNDATPVKQRPQARAQPICPPNASAKGFTMGRGRALTPPGQLFQQIHAYDAMQIPQIPDRLRLIPHASMLCIRVPVRPGKYPVRFCEIWQRSQHTSVISDDMEGLGNIEDVVCSCAEQAKAPGSEPAPVAAEAPVRSQMLNGMAGEAAAPAPDAVPAAASLGDAPPDARENAEAAEEAQGHSASPSAAEAPAPTPDVQSAPEVWASACFLRGDFDFGLGRRCTSACNALPEERTAFAGKHGAEHARCRAAAARAGRAHIDA